MLVEQSDTAANIAAANTVLAANERFFETDTGRWKFGDGFHTYAQLAYGGVSAATVTALTAAITSAGGLFLNGTASQLAASLQQTNCMVYLQCTTAGTALAISIGPTVAVADPIVVAGVATSGNLYSIWLPAGWYLKWAATTAAFATQSVHTCI